MAIPTKHLVEVRPNTEVHGPIPQEAEHVVAVRKVAAGPVSFMDKLKGYYHTIFTVLAALVVLLNELSSALGWIPDYGPKLAGYISVAVVLLTAVVNGMKSNESWVDDL